MDIEVPMLAELVASRNKLRDHYNGILRQSHSEVVQLHFTFDGNLVGDLGEALAVKHFGVRLLETKSHPGIDGHTADGKSTVQVKATGTGRGPAFRQTETKADYLLFFEIDFENGRAKVIFSGPEHYATVKLPKKFSGQRSLSASAIRAANDEVPDAERLPFTR